MSQPAPEKPEPKEEEPKAWPGNWPTHPFERNPKYPTWCVHCPDPEEIHPPKKEAP